MGAISVASDIPVIGPVSQIDDQAE